MIDKRIKAVYKLGNMVLKGYVTGYSIDNCCWFNTEEREKEGCRDLLVAPNDVLLIIK